MTEWREVEEEVMVVAEVEEREEVIVEEVLEEWFKK